MEYILVDESRLKVRLFATELKARGIGIEQLDYSDRSAKKLFEEILSYAKREFGFNSTARKVLMQIYPFEDGDGCDILITLLAKGEAAIPKVTDRVEGGTRIYGFERLCDLLSVCRILSGSCPQIQSSVWIDNGRRWYLSLTDERFEFDIPPLPPCPLSFISEFGEAEPLRTAVSYLSEYATCICSGNAAETFGKLNLHIGQDKDRT